MDNLFRTLFFIMAAGGVATFVVMLGIVLGEMDKEDMEDLVEREERRRRK